VLALRRGWSRSRLAGVAAGLAVASAGAMALLFRPGTDPSRVYYGTDTRSAALFVGVALALLLPPAEVARMPRRLLTAVGAIGLLGVATCAATFGERSTALYRGGFLLAAGFTGLAVLALTVEGPLSRLLGWAPLRWAGTRSYAIYLWHWPVIALTRPEVDLPLSGPPLLGLRLGVTLALAELSWRLVERPVLAGAAGRWWRASRPNRSSAILAGTAVATLTAAVLVSVGPPPPPPLLRAALRHVEAPPTTLLGVSTETTSTTVEGPAAEPVTTLPPEPQLVVPDVSAAPYDSFLAVGESVLLAARDTLGRASGGAAIVDAKIGRQVKDGLDALRTYRDRGDLGRVAAVVVHLGTNGRFTTAQFHQLADITKDVPRVVVVNVRVPREWEGESNATIAAGVPEHPNMRLVDWYDASRPHGVLSYDGIHPTRDGAKVYSRLVLDQLPPKVAPTTTTSAPPPPPPETTTTLPPETTTTAPPETTTTTIVPVTLPA
jgi:lysophospholipase L1-like esterase